MSSFNAAQLDEIIKQAIVDVAQEFRAIDAAAEVNTERVLRAFQRHRVSESSFAGSTGYGYGDKGRETLESVYAEVFNAEKALVRIGLASGTHAIAAALFGTLRPGQALISATGRPYDTLCSVIGVDGKNDGSLRDWGIKYSEYPLNIDGIPNIYSVAEAVKKTESGAVFIQRSRGYTSRRALRIAEIRDIADAVHAANPSFFVIVDNCYGEFVDTTEPTDAGADLIAGSLIKNPGGGIAPTGGYIAGRAELVERAAERLTAPGVGSEIGASLGINRLLFQGFFVAPHVVAQALKTSVFASRLFELLGFEVSPRFDEPRSDIVLMINTRSENALRRICEGIQSGSPVDAFVTPEPWDMPGYDSKIVMASGAFIQGSSIELSADAPIREPFAVFLQGGLTFEAGKLGVVHAVKRLLDI